jgi:hypothetical protein
MPNQNQQWMDDSFMIPASTLRIPMPRGAAVPRRDVQVEVIASLQASDEVSAETSEDVLVTPSRNKRLAVR